MPFRRPWESGVEGAVAAVPAFDAEPADSRDGGYFRGVAVAGAAPTRLHANFLNELIAELRNVAAAGGINPQARVDDRRNLLLAIQAIANEASPERFRWANAAPTNADITAAMPDGFLWRNGCDEYRLRRPQNAAANWVQVAGAVQIYTDSNGAAGNENLTSGFLFSQFCQLQFFLTPVSGARISTPLTISAQEFINGEIVQAVSTNEDYTITYVSDSVFNITATPASDNQFGHSQLRKIVGIY